jgi:hypothetical protein
MRSLTIWIMLDHTARRGFTDGFAYTAARAGDQNDFALKHLYLLIRMQLVFIVARACEWSSYQ